MGKKKTAAEGNDQAAGNTASRRKPSPDASLAALRRRAEKQLSSRIALLDELSKQDIKNLVQELGTTQIELEIQNEDLRRAQRELEESRQQYVDLYDFAPVGYFTLDPHGVIVMANLPGVAMLGMNRKELLNKPFILFVHQQDRDQFYLHLRGLLEGADRHSCELRLTRRDGHLFRARLESSAVRAGNPALFEILTSVSDISERRLAKEALARERSVLAAVMDATDVMLVYLDADFSFVWVNHAYAESGRMRPEEIIGKNHFALYPHPENEAIFRRVRDTAEPVFYKDKPFEFPDQPERGITYWDWSLVPVKDTRGHVAGLVFSLRETTKYKQAELALAESEERFRQIAENTADTIFQIDLEGRLIYSSASIRAFGYSPDEVLGTPFAKFLPAEELPKAMEAFSQVISGESLRLFEIKLLKTDGSRADFEISATPTVNKGVIVGVQGVARDITERKLIAETLKSSLERVALLAATAGELLRASEPRAAVESICRQVMKHLGCDVCLNFLAGERQGEFGLNLSLGVMRDSEERKAGDCLLSISAISDQVTRGGQPVVSGRDAAPEAWEGAARFCGLRSWSCHPLLGPGGMVVGTLFLGSRHRESFNERDLLFIRAVADQLAAAIFRMRGEEALMRQSQELVEANKELEAFSYTVSHDLRAPLRVIEGFADAITEDYGDLLPDTARDYFARVVAASQRMDQLITAMLDMARLTKREMKENTVNLTSMVEVAAHELDRLNPERRVRCSVAGGVKVRGDFDLLRIVIENLMSNAWKFTAKTEKARIEFGVLKVVQGSGVQGSGFRGSGLQPLNREPGTRNPDKVYYIRDNGAGFDMTYADKLFSPFRRMHSEADFPGLGIGLATVKKIITRHGGRIWAEAEPGKGATFYFTLAAAGGGKN